MSIKSGVFLIAPQQPWDGNDAHQHRTFLDSPTGEKFRGLISAEVPTGSLLFHNSADFTLGISSGVQRVIGTIVALVNPTLKVETAPGLPDLDDDSLFNPDGTPKPR